MGEALDTAAVLPFQQISLSGAAGGIPLRDVYVVLDPCPSLVPIATEYSRVIGCLHLVIVLHFLTFMMTQVQKIICLRVLDGLDAPGYEEKHLKISSKKPKAKQNKKQTNKNDFVPLDCLALS